MAARGAEFWQQVQEARRVAKQAEDQAALLIDQFNARPEDDAAPTWTIQTPTTNHARPRTLSASYWKNQRVLQLTFRNGQVYAYFEVTPQQAASVKRTKSTGKLINNRLNSHPYGEVK